MDHGESSLIQKYSEEEIELPPGFRFHPTDEELITHYLSNKALNSSFDAIAIEEVDLNKYEPWDLPKKSKLGEKECYFFSVRGRKYQTGLRTNRATEAGYWKATGKDKEIQRGKMLVGMKKTLVFYKGRPPKGEKTDWVMHEYRLEGNYAESDWVICRVFKKSSAGSGKKEFELAVTSSFEEEMVRGAPLPPLMGAHVTCFSNSFFQDAAFNPSAGASSSFYGGCSDGEFRASTVSISPETWLSTAMTSKISFVNEAGRNSFEEYLWNY